MSLRVLSELSEELTRETFICAHFIYYSSKIPVYRGLPMTLTLTHSEESSMRD